MSWHLTSNNKSYTNTRLWQFHTHYYQLRMPLNDDRTNTEQLLSNWSMCNQSTKSKKMSSAVHNNIKILHCWLFSLVITNFNRLQGKFLIMVLNWKSLYLRRLRSILASMIIIYLKWLWEKHSTFQQDVREYGAEQVNAWNTSRPYSECWHMNKPTTNIVLYLQLRCLLVFFRRYHDGSD